MTTVSTGKIVLEFGKVEVPVGALCVEVDCVRLAVPLQRAVPTVEVPSIEFVTVRDTVLHVDCVWLKVVMYVDRDELVRVVTSEEMVVVVMRRPDDVKIWVAVVVYPVEYVACCVWTKVLVEGTFDVRVDVLLTIVKVAGIVVLELGSVEVRVGALAVEVGFVCDKVPVVYSVSEAVLVMPWLFVIVLEIVLIAVVV